MPSRRLGWLAGGVVATALAYHLVATAAYPTFFRTPGGPVSYAWPLGWPLEFGTCSATGQIAGFRPLAAAADLLIGVVLLVGTGLAVSTWAVQSTLPKMSRSSLVVVVVSIACWAALLAALRVPAAVFLGWAALAVVYLAVPCTAYSIVRLLRPASQFSLRTLFLAISVIAVVLAALAGSGNYATRGAGADRARLVSDSVRFGVLLETKTMNGGRVVAWDYAVARQTRQIPCRLDTAFGVEYAVRQANDAAHPAPTSDRIDLVEVWHSPAPIPNRMTGKLAAQTEKTLSCQPGEPQVAVFRLGSEPCLVPGEWKFELWHQSGSPKQRQKLLEQTFELELPAER
jgi:hypothetical protein